MAPAFKWTDTTERMVLLKFLEQNSSVKFDAKKAAKSWPSAALGKTTERGIRDRFNMLKSKLGKKKIANTLGMTARASPVVHAAAEEDEDNQSNLATPVSGYRVDGNDNDQKKTCKPSPNPFSEIKGASTSTFQSRLLNGRSRDKGTPLSTRPRSNKRKRTDTASGRGKKKARRQEDSESEEEDKQTMTESNSESDTVGDSAEHETPTHKSEGIGSTGRRTLPSRRSKSATSTPGRYREQADSSEADNEDDDEVDDEDANPKSSSDELFHGTRKRGQTDSSTKGKGWRDIVARNNVSHTAQDQEVVKFKDENCGGSVSESPLAIDYESLGEEDWDPDMGVEAD